MKRPTVEDIKVVLTEYHDHPEYLESQAQWIHEQWHNESMEKALWSDVPVRYVTFGGIAQRLVEKFGRGVLE